ncbi:SDR family NAD(P)-dependent oxidoreductase [Rhodococcus sp. NPDC057529]|uniref:SDR family NAD(P)-dependent oxidoreductase n=1 Tax=Rhodococcus sp. NPDC057529 TaxID=3346158 RepID=UPI003671F104
MDVSPVFAGVKTSRRIMQLTTCDQNGHLAGKTVVITGAGNGLGRDYALACARHGAAVVVNDFGSDVSGRSAGARGAAAKVAQEVVDAGGQAVSHHGNVVDPSCGEELVKLAVDSFGRIDALVNNAGIVRDSPFLDMSMEDFDSVLDVHLRGTVRVTQPVYRHMVESGHGGVVVNTTSRSGLRGKRDGANYAAAKAGIVGFSNVLALEGAEHGVRVWTISPRAATRAWGEVETTSSGPMRPEFFERFPMDAVSQALVWMISDLSAPNTGRVVFASAEAVHEVRWDAALPFVADASVDAGAFADAAAQGRVLFPDDARSWI